MRSRSLGCASPPSRAPRLPTLRPCADPPRTARPAASTPIGTMSAASPCARETRSSSIPGRRAGPGRERGLAEPGPFLGRARLRGSASSRVPACSRRCTRRTRIDQATTPITCSPTSAAPTWRGTVTCFGCSIRRAGRRCRCVWPAMKGCSRFGATTGCCIACATASCLGGFAFLGAQGGRVRLREVEAVRARPSGEKTRRTRPTSFSRSLRRVPRLSIVTTVYDRVDVCATASPRCSGLTFRDYEHLIVADHPPPEVLERIRSVVAAAGDPRIGLVNLRQPPQQLGYRAGRRGLRRARASSSIPFRRQRLHAGPRRPADPGARPRTGARLRL